MARRKAYRSEKTRVFIPAIILIAGLLFLPAAPLINAQPDGTTELSRIKSIAATQHEIVMLLLEQNDYEKAVPEANKIFKLNWPADQEPLLLKELLILSNEFLRRDQAVLGLQLIEANENSFRQPSSRITILKEKGYLYKHLNRNDKALEYFKKALDLEKQDPGNTGAGDN